MLQFCVGKEITPEIIARFRITALINGFNVSMMLIGWTKLTIFLVLKCSSSCNSSSFHYLLKV